MSADGLCWFLAQIKPNCAHIAMRNLRRQGFEAFLPLAEETQPRNGRFVTAVQPLFPGYVFVAFDVGLGRWRAVNSTYGITRLVSFGRDPAPVPRDLVVHLMQRCDAMGQLTRPEATLLPGATVTVTQGPFANFVAQIEKIDPDQRVWLLLEIMGGQKRVAVEPKVLRAKHPAEPCA